MPRQRGRNTLRQDAHSVEELGEQRNHPRRTAKAASTWHEHPLIRDKLFLTIPRRLIEAIEAEIKPTPLTSELARIGDHDSHFTRLSVAIKLASGAGRYVVG